MSDLIPFSGFGVQNLDAFPDFSGQNQFKMKWSY